MRKVEHQERIEDLPILRHIQDASNVYRTFCVEISELNVSLGSERRASRRHSWCRVFFQSFQNVPTDGMVLSLGVLGRIAMRSFNMAISIPDHSGVIRY